MAWIVRWRDAWVIIILVVVLRSPTLFESMYLVDEGYSGAVAMEMLNGGTIYQTVVETRAPFTYYLYYVIFLIAGPNNLLAVHIAALWFVIATAWVIRLLGARIADDRAGFWAAVGYVIFSHTYLPRDTLAANIEIFTVLPLTLCMLCFVVGERQDRLLWLFMSGVCCGIATFFRQPSLVHLGGIGAYLLYIWGMARTTALRDVVRSGGMVFAGFLVCVGAVMAYHWYRGNWQDMIEWTWVIAMRYVNSETTVAFVVKRLFLVHGTFILAGGLLWYFGVKQLLKVVRSLLKNRTVFPGPVVMIAIWCIVAYLTLFTGWRFPGHYHLMVLPPLAILGGMAFTQFLQSLVQAEPQKARRIRRFLMGAAVVPALGFLVMAFIIRKDTVAFRPITDYIAAHTHPEDRIFVWGSAPHIYSFSGRRIASRFISGSHLLGMYASRPHKDIDESKWIVPGSWDMLEADLSAHRPELIIDMAPISSNWDVHPISRYPIMRTHLEAYRLEKTIQGAHIYRRIAS